MGDLEQRNPRDVVGRIYPECHSSRDSKEGRGRRERGKAERISNTPQADADANSKPILRPAGYGGQANSNAVTHASDRRYQNTKQTRKGTKKRFTAKQVEVGEQEKRCL